MITRYNYKWEKPEIISTPEFSEFEQVEQIEPLSYQDEKKSIIKEYVKKVIFVEKKRNWADFIKSFDIGTISEQVISHLTKGTPLVTVHTLPAGDYTPEAISRGAAIKREMMEKGITLDMIAEALAKSSEVPLVKDSNDEKKGDVENASK